MTLSSALVVLQGALGLLSASAGEKHPVLRVSLRNVGTRVARKQRVMLTWGWNFCLLSLPSEEWDLQATRLCRKGAARRC